MRITSRAYFRRSKQSDRMPGEFRELQRAAEAMRIDSAMREKGACPRADTAPSPGEMETAAPQDNGNVVNLSVHRAARHLRHWND